MLFAFPSLHVHPQVRRLLQSGYGALRAAATQLHGGGDGDGMGGSIGLGDAGGRHAGGGGGGSGGGGSGGGGNEGSGGAVPERPVSASASDSAWPPEDALVVDEAAEAVGFGLITTRSFKELLAFFAGEGGACAGADGGGGGGGADDPCWVRGCSLSRLDFLVCLAGAQVRAARMGGGTRRPLLVATAAPWWPVQHLLPVKLQLHSTLQWPRFRTGARDTLLPAPASPNSAGDRVRHCAAETSRHVSTLCRCASTLHAPPFPSSSPPFLPANFLPIPPLVCRCGTSGWTAAAAGCATRATRRT